MCAKTPFQDALQSMPTLTVSLSLREGGEGMSEWNGSVEQSKNHH